MSRSIVAGLVLALVLATTGTALAADEKMTREQYQARMDQLAASEGKANEQIKGLQADIDGLKKQLADLDAAIKTLNQEILTLVGANEAQIQAYGKRLDGVLSQLEGLMALPPEQLVQRRSEIKKIEDEVAELKKSKIGCLPEMKAKMDQIQKLLAQLVVRTAKPVAITYTVERGDNLWNISKKETIYDDPYMWPRLYRANKEKIKDPDLIYPKQELAVPFGVSENQYMVTRGDFLYKIAAQVYNDPGKWHKIYEANKQQIVEPHLVFPAQVLEIPRN